MGAYSNPQEVEGQQDLGGHARALQGMFDKVASGVENASQGIIRRRLAENEKILLENKQRAVKNDALLKELNEGEQNINVLVEKGKAVSKDGLNYDCFNGAADRWRALQLKIDKGEGSPKDKREVAQILASVQRFAGGAANTSGVIENVKDAKDKIGGGSYDEKGSDPKMLRIYMGLNDRNGKVLQPGFQKVNDGNGNLVDDYSQPGYTIFKWDEKNEKGDVISHEEEFMDAERLEKSLNGGAQGGLVFKTTYEKDNNQIREANKAIEGGGGIFETNKGIFTGKVTPAFLTDVYTRSQQVGGQGTGGIVRQPMVLVDQPKVLSTSLATINSVSSASAVNPNEVASKYFNYVAPVMDENHPNNAAYKKLKDYEQFQSMPDGFSYKSTIDIQDTETMGIINKNSQAAFMQTVPKSQAVGGTITISDKDYAWEKEANKKIPKNLEAAYNEAKAAGKNYAIVNAKLADGKFRKVLIATEKDEKGEGKLFIEIVGNNTNQ